MGLLMTPVPYTLPTPQLWPSLEPPSFLLSSNLSFGSACSQQGPHYSPTGRSGRWKNLFPRHGDRPGSHIVAKMYERDLVSDLWGRRGGDRRTDVRQRTTGTRCLGMDTSQGTADGLVFAGRAQAAGPWGRGSCRAPPTLESCTRSSSRRSGWWQRLQSCHRWTEGSFSHRLWSTKAVPGGSGFELNPRR